VPERGDHFHLVLLAHRALTAVRRRVTRHLPDRRRAISPLGQELDPLVIQRKGHAKVSSACTQASVAGAGVGVDTTDLFFAQSIALHYWIWSRADGDVMDEA
jgi:hypothetical protein